MKFRGFIIAICIIIGAAVLPDIGGPTVAPVSIDDAVTYPTSVSKSADLTIAIDGRTWTIKPPDWKAMTPDERLLALTAVHFLAEQTGINVELMTAICENLLPQRLGKSEKPKG